MVVAFKDGHKLRRLAMAQSALQGQTPTLKAHRHSLRLHFLQTCTQNIELKVKSKAQWVVVSLGSERQLMKARLISQTKENKVST